MEYNVTIEISSDKKEEVERELIAFRRAYDLLTDVLAFKTSMRDLLSNQPDRRSFSRDELETLYIQLIGITMDGRYNK
jgi:hypothetical protein